MAEEQKRKYCYSKCIHVCASAGFVCDMSPWSNAVHHQLMSSPLLLYLTCMPLQTRSKLTGWEIGSPIVTTTMK
jgi:hypothetical protein